MTPKMGEIFMFPIVDVQQKCLEEIMGSEKSTLVRDQLVRCEENSGDLQGSSDKSQPIDDKTDDTEARDDFWSIEVDCIYRHHVEPRIQLYVAQEETVPFPLRYIDVTRTYDSGCVARKPY